MTDLYFGNMYTGITEQDADETVRSVYGDIEIIKLPSVDGENAPAIRKLYITPNHPIILYFFKFDEKSSKAATAKADNMAKARRMAEHGIEADEINDILGTSFTPADIANMFK